jgi:hypothetical protein
MGSIFRGNTQQVLEEFTPQESRSSKASGEDKASSRDHFPSVAG